MFCINTVILPLCFGAMAGGMTADYIVDDQVPFRKQPIRTMLATTLGLAIFSLATGLSVVICPMVSVYYFGKSKLFRPNFKRDTLRTGDHIE